MSENEFHALEAFLRRGDEWCSRALTAEAALDQVRQVMDDLGQLTPANESEASVQAAFLTALRSAVVGNYERPER